MNLPISRITFYFIFLVAFTFFGCEKEEPSVLSRSELLISNTWVFKNMNAKGTGSDLLVEAAFALTYKGTEVKFNGDGTAFWKHSDGTVEDGIWYFNQDLTVITATFGNYPSEDYTILDLTSSILVVQVSVNPGTVEMGLTKK